jgi:ATP-dependent DNA ligase
VLAGRVVPCECPGRSVAFDGRRPPGDAAGDAVATSAVLDRNLTDATAQYASVARSVMQLRAETALLDGEIVALD